MEITNNQGVILCPNCIITSLVQKLAHDIHFIHLFVVIIAVVYARVSSSRNWFLTTTPDGIDTNNLDNLPSC